MHHVPCFVKTWSLHGGQKEWTKEVKRRSGSQTCDAYPSSKRTPKNMLHCCNSSSSGFLKSFRYMALSDLSEDTLGGRASAEIKEYRSYMYDAKHLQGLACSASPSNARSAGEACDQNEHTRVSLSRF
ncbi:hypothetical protein PGT21_013486 [Puccinia graminis f. sp. tritici]|uniref:Uncharacterized protein n=1 Tax=Puccinia graminis f. sp. tritici TaxID=56615 RepID=A0A5B0M1N2_PUCGR|nr:hypothetical protein PGT21_013486 [Puccinia graminis f. sp. tritici]